MAIDWSAQLEKLERALGQGAMTVQYPDGGFITYRSVGELEKAIEYARTQASAGTSSLSDAPSFAGYSKD